MSGIFSAQISWWPHCRQRVYFDVSKQFGTQVHPDATSNENTRCEGSNGQWKKLETIPASDFQKVKSKKEVTLEVQRDIKKVHFVTLMDSCNLKNAGGGTKIAGVSRQSRALERHCKRRLWNWFLSQRGSPVSQMISAKIMDVIERLPDCDGHAADADSAYSQVQWEDAHKPLKIPKSECPDIWIRLPRHKWPNHGKYCRSRGTMEATMITNWGSTSNSSLR